MPYLLTRLKPPSSLHMLVVRVLWRFVLSTHKKTLFKVCEVKASELGLTNESTILHVLCQIIFTRIQPMLYFPKWQMSPDVHHTGFPFWRHTKQMLVNCCCHKSGDFTHTEYRSSACRRLVLQCSGLQPDIFHRNGGNRFFQFTDVFVSLMSVASVLLRGLFVLWQRLLKQKGSKSRSICLLSENWPRQKKEYFHSENGRILSRMTKCAWHWFFHPQKVWGFLHRNGNKHMISSLPLMQNQIHSLPYLHASKSLFWVLSLSVLSQQSQELPFCSDLKTFPIWRRSSWLSFIQSSWMIFFVPEWVSIDRDVAKLLGVFFGFGCSFRNNLENVEQNNYHLFFNKVVRINS